MTKLQLLVPMDGTEFSRTIEPQISKLFSPDAWALRLLHVARVPVDPGTAAYDPATVGPDYRLYMYGYEMPGATLHPMYDEERLEEFRKMLESDLQDEVRLFERQGYEVSAAVHFGEPANAIVSYAEELGVDLVAMATHHRKGLDRLLHGSVARRALDHLSIPALLLRVEEGDEEAVAAGQLGERTERSSGYVAGGSTASVAHERHEGRGHRGAHMPRAAEEGASVHKDDHVVTPAETAPAKLGGMQGRGVLTILFGGGDEPVSTQGSWFPDDPEADLTPLEEAARNERSVIFEGRAIDAETSGHDDEVGEQVRRLVQVTSVRRYQDNGGMTRKLVSFELVGEPDMTDVPDQYTKEEFEALSLQELSDITGLDLPREMDAQAEAKFRAKAWDSYRIDIEHRDEWGTARQNSPLPHGE